MSSKIILFALSLVCFLYSGSESAAIGTDSVNPGARTAEKVADKAVGAVGGAFSGFGQGALHGASGATSGESEIHRSRRQIPNPASAIQQASSVIPGAGIFGSIADKAIGAFGGAFSGFGQGALHGTSGARSAESEIYRVKRQVPNPAAAIQQASSIIPGAGIFGDIADKAIGAFGGAFSGFGQGALHGTTRVRSAESEIHRVKRQVPNPAAAIQQASSIIPGAGIFGDIVDKGIGAFGGAFSGFGQGALHGTSGARSAESEIHRVKRQIPNPAAAIQQASSVIPGADIFGNIADKAIGAVGGAISGFGQGALHGTSGARSAESEIHRVKRQIPNPAAAIQQASSIIPGAGIFGQFADKAVGAVGGAFSGFGQGALHGTSGVGSTGSHRVKRQILPIPNPVTSVQQVTQVQQGIGSSLNGIPGVGIFSTLADKTVGAFGGAFSGFGQGVLNGSGGLIRRSVKEE